MFLHHIMVLKKKKKKPALYVFNTNIWANNYNSIPVLSYTRLVVGMHVHDPWYIKWIKQK